MILMDMVARIRPANMRSTHGLRMENSKLTYSTPAVLCVEGRFCDTWDCAHTGSGMDAPEDIPTGSVKAFFENNGSNNYTRCFGFCQRTVRRGSPC